MIFGISHITWPSLDLETDVRWLKEWGFREQFREQSLQNHPEKFAFMIGRSESMSMVFMVSARKIAVELVQYIEWPELPSSFYNVLWTTPEKNTDGSLASAPGNTKCPDAAMPAEIVCRRLGSSAIPASFIYDPIREWGVKGLSLAVNDLDQEIDFWVKTMGFSRGAYGKADEGRWICLNYCSPLPQWCMNIFLQESRQIGATAYMDGLGCNCLSVITSDIRSTIRRLSVETSGSVSAVFEVAAGQQLLEVCLVRSPGGALLEFFQIHN